MVLTAETQRRGVLADGHHFDFLGVSASRRLVSHLISWPCRRLVEGGGGVNSMAVSSNFQHFLKPRQIFCTAGCDERDVFQTHAADFLIIKSRLDGHDVAGPQFAC